MWGAQADAGDVRGSPARAPPGRHPIPGRCGGLRVVLPLLQAPTRACAVDGVVGGLGRVGGAVRARLRARYGFLVRSRRVANGVEAPRLRRRGSKNPEENNQEL